MSFHQHNSFERNSTSLPLVMNSSSYSSIVHPYSSINSNINYFSHSSDYSIDARYSNLFSPNHLEFNCQSNNMRISHSNFTFRQPIQTPHQRFLSRNEANCPTHLTDKQRKNWIKAGQQAQENQHLVSILNPFDWPTSNYDSIVYIHHRTSKSYLQGIIHKLSGVRLFTIDTEYDKPTSQFPHPLPALLQIQAVYEEKFSTVLLIELQFLPKHSTPLFQLIQTLCQTIFSSSNTILAWGDIHAELRSLEQFHLFDIFQITRIINLQHEFTHYWNKSHPHSTECLANRQYHADDSNDADVLICLVNTNDLDDDYDPSDIHADFTTCICSETLRPYKTKNPLWKLQKAVQYIFNLALNKSLTMNIWSSGLDPHLRTWQSNSDRITRQALTTYAVNDVFAPTNLFFHIQSSSFPIRSDFLPPIINHHLPFFLIISDSQGKFFPPISNTQFYNSSVKSISGLQWFNPINTELCTRTLILSAPISALLSSCTGVLFLVGTNSIRHNPATRILQQVEDIINLIQSQHVHLNTIRGISIIPAFPCVKLSYLFPNQESLSLNIDQYNYHLNQLSLRKNFTILNIFLQSGQLCEDGIHIHVQYISNIYNLIHEFFEHVIQQQQAAIQRPQRSRAAKTRRNKKRHIKLRQRQRSQSVTRTISRVWELHQLKAYLKHKNIQFKRIPEIENHQLHILFNHHIHQQFAENSLSFNEFNEYNYNNWISQQQ